MRSLRLSNGLSSDGNDVAIPVEKVEETTKISVVSSNSLFKGILLVLITGFIFQK